MSGQGQFYLYLSTFKGDRGGTVVLCYKSEGRWFDPSWYHWIFHRHKMALGSTHPLTKMSIRSVSWG
jgi:hypothetical protein